MEDKSIRGGSLERADPPQTRLISSEAERT